MNSTLRLGRIRGIAVGIHYTWLIAFALITWSLAAGFFPFTLPGYSAGTYWIMGALAALALFASVLVHELTHSFVAQARGLPVESITLFIFGGVSNIRAEAHDPQDEFLIAVVGPLSSLLLAGIFYGILLLTEPGQTPVGAILSYLALINLLLAVFNIIPGFPLDGGRVLRSILWGVTGSLRRATSLAATVGQIVAFLIIGLGIFQFFSGNLLGGLWLVLIGWFLNSAAESSRGQVLVSEALGGVRVRDIMRPDVETVSPELLVSEFVYEQMIRRGRRALPVVQDGVVAGIVTITDVKELPADQWSERSVAEIMTRPPLKTIGPDAGVEEAMRLLVEQDVNQLLVVSDDRLVGMISRADIMRFMQLQNELHLERDRGLGFLRGRRPV